MKILLLNPVIHAEHKIAKSLERRGVAILFAENRGEAWEILRLHGESIDLGIIHREGKESKDSGVKLLEKIKASSVLKQLPIVLTTDEWSDAECAVHQQSPQGVNAYLHAPFTDAQLTRLIGEILGPDQLSSGPVIEDLSQVDESINLTRPLPNLAPGQAPIQVPSPTQSQIRLDAPESANLAQTSGANTTIAIDQSPESAGTVAVEDVPAPTENTIAVEAEPVDLGALAVAGVPLAYAAETRVVDVGSTDALMIPTMALDNGQGLGLDSGRDNDQATRVMSEGTQVIQPDAGIESPATRVLDLSDQLPNLREGTQVLQVDGIDALPLTGLSLPIQQLNEEGELQPAEIGAGTGQTAKFGSEVNPPEMPYLFGSNEKNQPDRPPPQPPAFSPTQFLLHHPIGDAVVPGGAANSPDIEVMRRYLILREQDVVALSNQLKEARDRLGVVEQLLEDEKSKNNDLTYTTTEKNQKIEQFEGEKKVALESLEAQVTDLTFDIKVRSDRAKLLENQLREKADELVRLKERVRADIRKIRVREKELENKLEMSKKDSESLITSGKLKLLNSNVN